MPVINDRILEMFKGNLQESECSRSTIEKYIRDVRMLAVFCNGVIMEKKQLFAFKEYLKEKRYAATSINSMLAAVNRFLSFIGHEDWKLRYLKVQKDLFVHESRELRRKEYETMVEFAKRSADKRLAMLLQTICATGIRVSELQAITVESLSAGQARIYSKGKLRLILIPKTVCRELKRYCKDRQICSGSVFITRSGKSIDRSNIWKMLKRLAQKANVQPKKVFPHNLRHLFACTYYEKYQDIVRLADILGHSSIDTTRIYTKINTKEQILQIDRLGLLSTT